MGVAENTITSGSDQQSLTGYNRITLNLTHDCFLALEGRHNILSKVLRDKCVGFPGVA